MRAICFFILEMVLMSSWTRAADIRIVGTDLLGPDFSRSVGEWAERNHLSVSVKLEGSRLGQDALNTHQADVGLLVFAPEETLPAPPLILKPWAYEIAVIVVSERMPVTRLSFLQLGGVFGATGQVEVSLWGELGAAGEWATRPVSAHGLTTQSGGGVALDLFRSTVLGNAAFKSNVALYSDARELLGKLSAEEGSIAILPNAPAPGTGLKVLLVARAIGDPAFPPSPENVQAGDYPLRLTVYMVVPREAVVTVRPLLRFLLSDEGLPVAKQSHLIPLPATVRAKQTQEFDSF